MEFELINPSDPYTFIAKNREVAAITVFVLGTMYGAQLKEDEDGKNEVPVFILGGAEEWYEEQFGHSVDEGIEKYRLDVAEALESFMLGNFEDRERYETALSFIDNSEKKDEFKKKWQDSCSSLNDIGTRAHDIAKEIKKAMKKAD